MKPLLRAGVWLLLLLPLLAQARDVRPMPAVNQDRGLYEVEVEPGVSYEDVIDSLKVVSAGENFVNPANLPIGDHLRERGQIPEGPLEVRGFCNLGLGAEIMLDHPEFVTFAPCRIGIYQRQGKLYLGLARPTFDLRSIQNPTPRARKAAQELETILLRIMDKARQGDI